MKYYKLFFATLFLSGCGGGSDVSSVSNPSGASGPTAHALAAAVAPTCNGINLVNVVGHSDDDILFINPAISNAIKQGGCVTTVFMIGGSNDGGFDYVLQRESASKVAYARMAGTSNSWITGTVSAGTANVQTATLSENTRIRLVFLRVPGGGVRGGDVPLANIFDKGASVKSWPYTDVLTGPTNSYTKRSLTNTLTQLLTYFSATSVNALNPDVTPYTEHPDHIYSAKFTRDALRSYKSNIPVYYHETYTSASAIQNSSPEDTQVKRDIFAAYAMAESNSRQSAFLEDAYNGNWIARRNFKAANAFGVPSSPAFPLAPLVNLQTQHCIVSSGLGKSPYMYGCSTSAPHEWRWVPTSANVGGRGTALLQSAAGTCLSETNSRFVESICSEGDLTQRWTPWDFGKIFTPSGACLDVRAGKPAAVACGDNVYNLTALWTRNIVNADSDTRMDIAMVGDVVGDKTEKLINIRRRPDGPGINVWVANLIPGAATIPSDLWFDGNVEFSPTASTPTCQGPQLCFEQTRFMLADFTGDGKSDLMAAAPNQGGVSFWLMKSSVRGFSAPQLWAQTTINQKYSNTQQFLAGDFDGDGKTDVLLAQAVATGGLKLIVLKNAGTALGAPTEWANSTFLKANTQLFAARLNPDASSDVIAVDKLPALRVSTFTSTGSGFVPAIGVRTEGLFDSTRSRVQAVTSSVTGLTDIWVLHARSDGTAINFWSMTNNGARFDSPLLRRTEYSLAWSNIAPTVSAVADQLWLPYKSGTAVTQYEWSNGNQGVKSIQLSPSGIQAPPTDYGVSVFSWVNLKWRARLN